MMEYIQVFLSGYFQVRKGGNLLVGFESNKVRALLAYLAMENSRPLPRESLAELLWPDHPDGFALANLRWVVHNLHELLLVDQQAAFLEIQRDFIQFNLTDEIWVDTLQFENLIRDGSRNKRIAPVEQAIGLYRGNFLDGLVVKQSSQFDEWALLQRERLNQKYLHALYLLTNHRIEAEDFELAEESARRQLELEPWKEEAHQQLMRCLACSGERSEALTQFEHCRRALQKELGVQPSQETFMLYQQINQGELKVKRPTNLE
jgi:DNA-binding SARP family transcriptional activator